MTSSNRSWYIPARNDSGERLNPLPGLVERLLDLLLREVRASRSAQLDVSSGSKTSTYAEVGEPDQPGPLVSASTALPDGGTVTLTVRGDPSGELRDDEPTQAQLRRFLPPMLACVALERQLDEQAGQAREAVAEIERLAITDLATGIVMARRDCDSQTARRRLAEWGTRTGNDIQALTAVRILELLTADQP
jgi:hypothetical protein